MKEPDVSPVLLFSVCSFTLIDKKQDDPSPEGIPSGLGKEGKMAVLCLHLPSGTRLVL